MPKPKSKASWVVRVEVDFLDHEKTPLGSSQKIALLVLESYARAKAGCWASNDAIGKKLGVKARRAQGLFVELEAAGYIRRVFDPNDKTRMGILLLKRADPSRPCAPPNMTDAAALKFMRFTTDRGAKNDVPLRKK